MFEELKRKVLEVEGLQLWVQRTDEVLVEPLCFLDLKTYPFDRFKLFGGKVYYKTYA